MELRGFYNRERGETMRKNLKLWLIGAVAVVCSGFLGISSLAAENYPATYTSTYVTPDIKNQGMTNGCWAVSATTAIEANVVKNKDKITSMSVDKNTLDLSELHLMWFAQNTMSKDKTDTAYNDGVAVTDAVKIYTGSGEDYKTACYLARGAGMDIESDAPLVDTSFNALHETQRFSPLVQLHDFYRISYYKDQTSIDQVKKLVSECGAATVGYYSAESSYGKGSDGSTSYCSLGYGYSGPGVSHQACIIGWDDNYAASNFKNTPKANGAWLVQNSWGDGWGQNGKFWMSYYEPTLGSAGGFQMIDGNRYGRVYNYTPHDDMEYYSIPYEKKISAANQYQSKSDEKLKAVGVFTESDNVKASIKVYTSAKKMKNPELGDLVYSQSDYDTGLKGFHTVDLTQEIPLKKGQFFSIVVTLENAKNSTLYYPVEKTGKEVSGQTFYLNSAGNWVDATNRAFSKYKNARIYAYTAVDEMSTALLDQYISEAENLNAADVKYYVGAEYWNKIQVELALAKKAASASLMKRSERALGNLVSGACSQNLYTTATGATGPGANGVELYLNGGSVKKNGITKNYKTVTLYPRFYRAKSWVWKNKKNKVVNPDNVKAVLTGKYVVAVTNSFNTKPYMNLDGTIANNDEEAKAVVNAKISGNKVILSPKSEGTAYVWVLWYPKSDAYQDDALSNQMPYYSVTRVSVGTAPANVRLYYDKTTDPTSAESVQYTNSVVPAGFGVDVYVKGTIGAITKKANTLQEIKNSNIGYLISVPAKYQSYIQVVEKEAGHFRMDVDQDILGLVKTGKIVSVPVSIICDKNGRKAVFTMKVGNPVKSIEFAAGDNTNLEKDAAEGIDCVSIGSAQTASQIGYIIEKKMLYDDSKTRTDAATAKIIKLSAKDAYQFNTGNGIVTKGTLTAEQKKISLSLVKGKTDTYKISAAKGTKSGTVVYFMLYYNGYNRQGGFRVIKVRVE